MEKIFTINLREAYGKPRNKRAPRAIKIIKEFALRHMKGNEAKVSIKLNAFIWAHSIQKPPRRVKVKMLKKDDVVYIFHIDEEAKVPEKKVKKAEEKKEEKEKPLSKEKPEEEKKKAEKEKVEEKHMAKEEKKESEKEEKKASKVKKSKGKEKKQSKKKETKKNDKKK